MKGNIFKIILDNFGVEGTQAIADLLKTSNILWIDLSTSFIFNIGYCNIAEAAMIDLVDAANSCKTLKTICLRFIIANIIGDNWEIKEKDYGFKTTLSVKFK